VVGPPGASPQRATTFVVARFHLPPTLCPTTSLACKSETEVVFYRASTLFAPRLLPRKSEPEEGFHGVSTPFTPTPPPSCAKARRRWRFMRLRPRTPTTSLACNSETEVAYCGLRPRSVPHHLPHSKKRDGCGVLWGFEDDELCLFFFSWLSSVVHRMRGVSPPTGGP